MVPFKYNLRNLIVRWRTTLLTALGFTLVVALLVVMLAFVNGLYEMTENTGRAGNVIILRDGANDEIFSDIAIDANVSQLWNNHQEILTDADTGQAMASQEVYSIVTQEIPPAEPDGRPTYRFLQVRGVEDPEMAGKVHNLPLKPGGRWLERQGSEIVLGEGIARTLRLSVGDVFTPRPPLKWTVVGIMDSAGSAFNSEIWAKREEVGKYFGKDNEERKMSFYTSVVVSTADLATAEKLARELPDRTKQIKVNAMTERHYYEEMSKSNRTFLIAAIIIAVTMAAGGMFGLMNTMFAAVSQRIKDIGVLRILGYARWQLLISFLLESLLLAVIGGGLGLLLGFLVNGVEQTGSVSAGQGASKTTFFKLIVDDWVIRYAAGFTLAMGLLGGLLPSLTAMRVRPLESLR